MNVHQHDVEVGVIQMGQTLGAAGCCGDAGADGFQQGAGDLLIGEIVVDDQYAQGRLQIVGTVAELFLGLGDSWERRR